MQKYASQKKTNNFIGNPLVHFSPALSLSDGSALTALRHDAYLSLTMAILFHSMVARPASRLLCATLFAGFCLLPGCQPFSPLSADVKVVNLPELCKLSIEELLRVTVIDDPQRHAPLLDLPLEELLMIEVVRHSKYSVTPLDASAASRGATMD